MGGEGWAEEDMTTEVDKTASIVANFISIALLDDMSLLLYLQYCLMLATDAIIEQTWHQF